MTTFFVFYWSKTITKVILLLSLVLLSTGFSRSFAFEEKLTEDVASKGRLAQVIKKTNVLMQPSYQSDTAGSVAAKEKINIQKRKSAWYFISTENLPKTGQLFGWISMLNVRFIATAKRGGELGVGSLFSSVTNDSLPTVSTGVRGFDENDLKNAKADLKQLLLLNTYLVSTGAAARFAQQGKLKANKIKVKED
jgi:hypothetical protein